MAMAEKLSVQQLQQAIQSGSLPAYIGIPLIEQKTKEKAQMAAAQQGQEKPPSVVASILQKAEQQEQQPPGIDQLPSNLPMMDEGENGMASGGIVAFAEEGQVRDPDQDPRIIALRQDPSYLAFAENATAEGKDPSLTAFLEAGNLPPRAPAERNGVDIDRPTTEVMYPDNPDTYPRGPAGNNQATNPETQETDPQTMADRQAIRDRMNIAAANARDLGSIVTRAAGTVADYGARGINALGGTVPRPNAKYTFNRSDAPLKPNLQALLAGEGGFEANYPVSSQPAARPNIDSQYIAQDAQEGNRGITAAPGARLAPSGTPGATAPGGVSPATARQISATNPGAPATLKDAERQAANGSTQASAAVSMVDKYIAMLEKSGEDVGRQKKEALYMALIQGGLAAAGGTSPNAFANIAAGMVPAVQGYQQALAGIRKEDRARIEKLINAGMSKEKLAMELKKLGIEEKKVDAMVNYYNYKATGGGGGGDKDSRQLRQLAFQANSKYLETQRDAPKLKNTQEYRDAASIIAIPLAKNASPMMVERRKQAQQIVDDVNSQITGRVNEARIARDFWSGEANFDPAKMYSRSASGKKDIDLGQFFNTQ